MNEPQDRRKRRMSVVAIAVAIASIGLATALIPASAGAGGSLLDQILGLVAPQQGGSSSPNLLCSVFRICPPAKPTTTTTATTATTRPPSTTTSTATTLAPTTTTTAPAAEGAGDGEADPSGPPTCGGVPTRSKPGGGTWTCTFDDEFSGTALDRTKWQPLTTRYTGFSSGTKDCFMDSTDNISVSGGTLVLTTRKESQPFTCQVSNLVSYQTRVTSGSVTTFDRFAQTYGRFEVRAKFTGAEAKGLQSALWLWPKDPEKYGKHPKSGEIDFAEIYNGHPDHVVPYIHYNNEDADPDHTADCPIDDFSKFHTYVVEWTTASIKISFDGVTCLDDAWTPKAPQTGRQPFDQPFIVALTQGLGVQMTNAYEPANTPLPASTVIDYVRVYG